MGFTGENGVNDFSGRYTGAKGAWHERLGSSGMVGGHGRCERLRLTGWDGRDVLHLSAQLTRNAHKLRFEVLVIRGHIGEGLNGESLFIGL